jgi:hypothetical protein
MTIKKTVPKRPKKSATSRKTKPTKAWTFAKYKNGKLNILKAPARFKNM